MQDDPVKKEKIPRKALNSGSGSARCDYGSVSDLGKRSPSCNAVLRWHSTPRPMPAAHTTELVKPMRERACQLP